MSGSGDIASLNTGSIRFRRLRVGIVVLGVLALVAFDAASIYDSWRSYQHSIVATDREIGNLARSLAEQTAWTWQGVDLLLDDTARWYRHDGHDMLPERLDESLATRTAAVRQVSLVTIVDADGIQRYRSRGVPPPNLSVADRSYFIAQRDHAAQGFFMSEPLVTRSENRAGVVVSRRLDGDNGAFAGVITAIVDLDDLKQFYTSVNTGMGSAIHLLREDGTLLVRNPATPEAVALKFPALAIVPNAPATRLVNPIDGREDFIAVARVRDTPLVLAVTREKDAALRPWRDEAIRVGVRTLILTLLGMLTIAALLRQLRRVEASERALRASEERYALAMEGANEGHWDWDIATDRLFLSPKMKALAGLGEDRMIATRSEWSAAVVIHPDDTPLRDAALADHFEGRTPRYECEYRARQPNGTWCWLSVRGNCLRDAAGKPYRFVGSAIEITAQKQARIEKEHLETQLRQSQKMEAIGTLAGGIAHDFNNILGAILGYGELAQQQAAPGSTLRRYLDNVMHAAERAKALVDRILGFSRSGLGERVPMKVQSVIEETLELLSASLPAGVRLEKRLEAGDAAVIGDATYLHQVAMNLCTNALHAMEHGGVLSVALERVELSGKQVLSRGTLTPGSYVRLSVGDTGSGIAPGVLERMFDPFFTTKGVGQGTGLGLSLVHGIVTELGGAIDVTTEAGAGTRFSIWLPLTSDAGEPFVPATTRELPRGHGEVVMIVDDESPLVTLAEEMLAEIGYEPVGFHSSGAALRAFRAEPRRFDLVLTDEAMPDLVGTELASEIRKLQTAVPIILMSGHGGPQLAKRAAAIGVNEVLHKPLQRRDLAESLARVLGAIR
ncbi:MAG TPA: ATP-binding protein [Steroidobacteraceae bacterium]|jgi:PAS domain S-box-containing protein|nr:ATP-binding protein [Steroidobacteraceae bacterium]